MIELTKSPIWKMHLIETCISYLLTILAHNSTGLVFLFLFNCVNKTHNTRNNFPYNITKRLEWKIIIQNNRPFWTTIRHTSNMKKTLFRQTLFQNKINMKKLRRSIIVTVLKRKQVMFVKSVSFVIAIQRFWSLKRGRPAYSNGLDGSLHDPSPCPNVVHRICGER